MQKQIPYHVNWRRWFTSILLGGLSTLALPITALGHTTIEDATPEESPASGAAASKESSAQTVWKPSTELCSVDHEYCVKIVAETHNPDHRKLIVSSRARVLAQFPTFGYLMDAFWSPNNKYVAINNRRANAGDYLWVISLRDGAALKMPDDLASEIGKKNLGHINGDDPWGKTVREVTTRFTECAHDRLDHQFLFAQGWKSASELLVLEELQFSNEPPQSATITAPGPGGKIVTRSVTATVGYYGPGAPGIWIVVNKACRVTGNKVTLNGQTIEKHEHSSEFVNRAWTYGAYWMQSPGEDFFISAQAKQAKGDLDGAIADFNHVIEVDPKNALAYFGRGNAKGAKGDVDGAIADYNRTLELDPKNVYAYNNRGLAKEGKGDVDGAIADYNRAIELDSKCADAYNDRGLTKALLRDWAGALADYRRFCELSESGQDYPRLSIWLIRTRLGETEAASKELSTYLDKRQKTTSGDWFSKVAEHLLGKVSEADLFAAAGSPDAKTDRGQHCEAWFYAGMRKLFSGDKKTAANYFHKCLATEQKDFTEFQLAQSELQALATPAESAAPL